MTTGTAGFDAPGFDAPGIGAAGPKEPEPRATPHPRLRIDKFLIIMVKRVHAALEPFF